MSPVDDSNATINPINTMTTIHDKFEEEQKITRRSLLLAGGKALLGSILLGRLTYLGVLKSSQFSSLAEGNRIKLQFMLPKRGIIYDRRKQVLADNVQSFQLVVIPEDTDDVKLTIRNAARLLSLSEEEQAQILQTIKSKPRFVQTTVAENLSWDMVCRLEVNMLDLPGCSVENGWMRYYPNGLATTHTIGYVQTPSEDEHSENPLFHLADFRVGKTGLEKAYDEDLQGTAGYKQIEVNARNRLVRELKTCQSQTGQELHVSLDLELQQYLQERLLNYESAGAVVLDVLTGQVLGLHSHPSFDPNLFTKGISSKNWQGLMTNPYRPLHNKVLQGLYPPGSIFKIIVALAALEAGIITSSYTTQCSGHIEISGHPFHCWQKDGHGRVNLVHALRQSCDIYFYEIAQKLGIERIAAMATRFGFGSLTDIEIPGEKAGLVPTKSWKMFVKNQSWTVGDTVLIGIGQGALLVTPLQLALAMARLVHPQQQKIIPSLLKDSSDLQATDALNIKPQFIDIVKQGLDDTVNSPFGLAYQSRILASGLEMGGKTSTVQVRRISLEERAKGVLKNEQRPWAHRDHAIFAGYAPIHQPRYAVSVIVEHGGGGGRVAAPLGRDILMKTQELMKRTDDI